MRSGRRIRTCHSSAVTTDKGAKYKFPVAMKNGDHRSAKISMDENHNTSTPNLEMARGAPPKENVCLTKVHTPTYNLSGTRMHVWPRQKHVPLHNPQHDNGSLILAWRPSLPMVSCSSLGLPIHANHCSSLYHCSNLRSTTTTEPEGSQQNSAQGEADCTVTLTKPPCYRLDT